MQSGFCGDNFSEGDPLTHSTVPKALADNKNSQSAMTNQVSSWAYIFVILLFIIIFAIICYMVYKFVLQPMMK